MEKNKMGVATFLGSEVVFFSLLILAYAYYRPGVTGGVTADKVLDPAMMAPFSVMLWASSATIWRAGENLKQGNRSRAWLWLVITIGLGLGFLIGEGVEWSGLITQNITIEDNLFTTTFFTLTGFHGFHVLVGLVALAILLRLARLGDFEAPPSPAVEAISLYWHFVDVVWVVIFSVVYLRILL